MVTVVDDPQTAACSYWQGPGETSTREVIERFCRPDLDYVDLGAWVGMTVLWAAPLSRQVIAVEPDQSARASLMVNASANADNVTVVPLAVSDQTGSARLEQGTCGWGDSMSSLICRRGAAETVEVDTITLPDLWEQGHIGECSLVKIDIEGGEGLVLPAACEFLHDLGCPVHLSLHWNWIPADRRAAVQAALDTFTMETLDGSPMLPTVLLS